MKMLSDMLSAQQRQCPTFLVVVLICLAPRFHVVMSQQCSPNQQDALQFCRSCDDKVTCESLPNCNKAIEDACRNNTDVAFGYGWVYDRLEGEFGCNGSSIPYLCVDCTNRSLTEVPCFPPTTVYALLAGNEDLTRYEADSFQSLRGRDIAVLDLSHTGLSGFEPLTSGQAFAGMTPYNIFLDGLNLSRGIGRNAFHGMTVFNDFHISNTTISTVSAFAFSGITVYRNFYMKNSEVNILENSAFRTFTVQFDCHMSNLLITSPEGLSSGAFNGFVVFNNFYLDGMDVRQINPYAFWFLSVGTFRMNGSTIADATLHERTFSGMIITYANYESTYFNETFIPFLDISDCGITTIISSYDDPNNAEGPFRGLIMTISAKESYISLASNDISVLSEGDLLDASAYVIDLSNNTHLAKYERGWGGNLIQFQTQVNTTGNENTCRQVNTADANTIEFINTGAYTTNTKLNCTCSGELTGTGTFCDNSHCPKELVKELALSTNGGAFLPFDDIPSGSYVTLECPPGSAFEENVPNPPTRLQCLGGSFDQNPDFVPTCEKKMNSTASGLLYTLVAIVVILMLFGIYRFGLYLRELLKAKKQRDQQKEELEEIEYGWTISHHDLQVSEKVLGDGGHGVVMAGHFHRVPVAIKFLKENPDTVARLLSNKEFEREADLMKSLHHPNLVALYGYGVRGIDRFIVTEQMSANLSEILQNQKSTLTYSDRLGFCDDICTGMHFLHFKKHIHCDLKSPNCLVKIERDGHCTVKIADFGTSVRGTKEHRARHNSNHTVVGKIRGSLAYMAPELLRSEEDIAPFSFKSDVYAFGIVMSEIVSGEIPYHEIEGVHFLMLFHSDENDGDSENRVLKGRRPHVDPACCGDDYMVLMKKCWHESPLERPTFERIMSDVTECENWRDPRFATLDVVPIQRRSRAERPRSIYDVMSHQSSLSSVPPQYDPDVYDNARLSATDPEVEEQVSVMETKFTTPLSAVANYDNPVYGLQTPGDAPDANAPPIPAKKTAPPTPQRGTSILTKVAPSTTQKKTSKTAPPAPQRGGSTLKKVLPQPEPDTSNVVVNPVMARSTNVETVIDKIIDFPDRFQGSKAAPQATVREDPVLKPLVKAAPPVAPRRGGSDQAYKDVSPSIDQRTTPTEKPKPKPLRKPTFLKAEKDVPSQPKTPPARLSTISLDVPSDPAPQRSRLESFIALAGESQADVDDVDLVNARDKIDNLIMKEKQEPPIYDDMSGINNVAFQPPPSGPNAAELVLPVYGTHAELLEERITQMYEEGAEENNDSAPVEYSAVEDESPDAMYADLDVNSKSQELYEAPPVHPDYYEAPPEQSNYEAVAEQPDYEAPPPELEDLYDDDIYEAVETPGKRAPPPPPARNTNSDKSSESRPATNQAQEQEQQKHVQVPTLSNIDQLKVFELVKNGMSIDEAIAEVGGDVAATEPVETNKPKSFKKAKKESKRMFKKDKKSIKHDQIEDMKSKREDLKPAEAKDIVQKIESENMAKFSNEDQLKIFELVKGGMSMDDAVDMVSDRKCYLAFLHSKNTVASPILIEDLQAELRQLGVADDKIFIADEDTELAVWKAKCNSAAAVPILVCEEVLGSKQLIDFVETGGSKIVKVHTAPLTELMDAARKSGLKGRFTKFYMDPSSSDSSESLEHVDEVTKRTDSYIDSAALARKMYDIMIEVDPKLERRIARSVSSGINAQDGTQSQSRIPKAFFDASTIAEEAKRRRRSILPL